MHGTRIVAGVAGMVLAVVCAARTSSRDAQARGVGAASEPAIEPPAWLFPHAPAGPAPAPWDSVTPIRIPRGRTVFTMAQLKDLFAVPDWDSTAHPPMPPSVARGRRPTTYACGYCHMPEGNGRPENAAIAGLPAAYIVQQVHDIASHARRNVLHAAYGPFDNMRLATESVTDAELESAAAYFASLRFRPRTRVVETARIPHVMPQNGLYFPATTPGSEPLNGRLVEVAQDGTRHELRDPYITYTAYVPVGSIARGRQLAGAARAGLASCTSCHGPQLRGLAAAPPLAGRSPMYLVRQLLAFHNGDRDTPLGAPMRAVAAPLSLDEMVALAAYAATLRP